MTNYLIPLFGDKASNHNLIEQIKQQTTVFDNDDLIVGFYRFDASGLSERFNQLFDHQYGLKMHFEDQWNFVTFTQSFLEQLRNQAKVSLKALSLILSYFSLFGLTVRPVSHKEDRLNQLFLNLNSEELFDWSFWLDNLIFMSGFYNPMTNAPFENFNVNSYFSDEHFLNIQMRILNSLQTF